MGSCQYRYNASEIYQKQTPGAGTETHCGGRTWPALDEPEMVPVTVRDGEDVRTEYHHTGQWLPRAADDPHCPAHGGTPEPPPRVLTWVELAGQGEQLESARRAYVAELERAGVAIPQALQVSPAAVSPMQQLDADTAARDRESFSREGADA